MITLIHNILDLEQGCQLVSCHFDVDEFKQQSTNEIEDTWGISIPTKINNAVDKRKAEFIAGRYCAKKALQALGVNQSQLDGAEIGIGEKRQPLWPDGLVGSITHSHGFAAAMAARSHTVRSIGIDSEFSVGEKTANNVSSHILTDEESFQYNTDLVNTAVDYLTLVFSAKESIFKCLHPLVLQYFDFRDAVVSLSKENKNTFEFRLLKDLNSEFCCGYQGKGHYRFDGDFVHTAVILNKS